VATDPSPERDGRTIGELLVDVSEQTGRLIRTEIELAKAEIGEKISKLARGGAVAIAAGVFVLLALAMAMHAVAWLLNDLLFEGNVWLGFLVEAGGFLLLAALAGLYAWRAFVRGTPPIPEMAIEEARKAAAELGRGSESSPSWEQGR